MLLVLDDEEFLLLSPLNDLADLPALLELLPDVLEFQELSEGYFAGLEVDVGLRSFRLLGLLDFTPASPSAFPFTSAFSLPFPYTLALTFTIFDHFLFIVAERGDLGCVSMVFDIALGELVVETLGIEPSDIPTHQSIEGLQLDYGVVPEAPRTEANPLTKRTHAILIDHPLITMLQAELTVLPVAHILVSFLVITHVGIPLIIQIGPAWDMPLPYNR